MKHLILVRHAKSSWRDPSLHDHDRGLNKRGARDTPIMADRLADSLQQFGVKLDKVYSSTALRARILAQAISDSCDSPLELDPALYTFSAEQISGVISKLPSTAAAITVVGHNPAVSALAERLSAIPVNHLPTSAYVILACDIQDWSELFGGVASDSSDIKFVNTLEINYPKRDLV